ncbi:MAG TPA: TolC family protein [Longimicrobiales bacterium]
MKFAWLRPVIIVPGMAIAVLRPAVAGAQTTDPRTVTLDEAIRLALENDPAAVAAEAAVASASADLLTARGAWLPTLTVGSSYANSSNQRFDQVSGRLVSENYSARVTASYDLFSGGRRIAQHRVAGARLDAAEADHRAQRFLTTLRTTELFYAAAAAEELVAIAEQRLARAEQQLEFARTRLDVGTATRSDVLRAEIEVGNARIAVVDAEAARRGARLELGRILGLANGARPASMSLPERAPALPPLDELVRRAEARSPEVVAARARAESFSAARWAARTAYLPTVGLSSSYDWFAFQFPPDQESWSVRLTVSLPVFNGFQREAGLQRAAASERSARARARDAEIAVRNAVETGVIEVKAAEERIAIAGRAVELAREDLRVQEERYQIGNATIVELQTSQVALADAEVAYLRARQALGVAIARLEATLGEQLVEDS